MKLGSYPSRRYAKSWMTQRILNHAPSWTHIRKSPTSVGHQILNPVALSIQETLQQLSRERFNMFASTADLNQLGLVYWLQLPEEMEFQYEEDSSGQKIYIPPQVYATIGGTEYEITQAENNNVETLGYDCLISRIQDAEVSHTYEEVIPKTMVANLSSTTPNDIVVDSHLYVTLEDNSYWEKPFLEKVYYPKVYIAGITRKGTTVTEVIPFRYNGTFKTVNEWQSISSVSASYLDENSYLTLETFPWQRNGHLDQQNILVPAEGGERPLFLDLDSRSWGSTLVGKSFTVSSFDIVRSGLVEQEVFYEMELLDENENNVELNDFVLWPNSKFMYAIDDTNFYVYDTSLEFPNTQNLAEESPDTKFDLWSERWIYMRGDTASIRTRNNAVLDPPSRTRWTLLTPSGNKYYVTLSGTLLPTTSDAWISNNKWGDSLWDEQQISLLFSENGEYVVTFEAQYWNDETNVSSTLKTKYLFFVPSITPEVQFALPDGLAGVDKISLDSDLNVWLRKYGSVHKLDVFHDYFFVDYESKRIWCKEEYPSVRITV